MPQSLPPAADEPRPDPGWWDKTPAQAARYDRMYWNRDED
jgi:hypothetical protein